MDLPKTIRDWKSRVMRAYGRDLPPTPSEIQWTGGSHVTERQFLALRCYWQDYGPVTTSLTDSDARRLDIYGQWGPAKRWLNAYPPFRAYLDHVKSNRSTTYWDIGDPEEDAYDLGIMEIPRKTQQMITAAVRDEKPRDEQMVITSLVSFLQSITIANRAVRCEWSSQRKYLTANFGGSSLSLFADGILVDRATNDIKVLLEAKRDPGNDKRLSWQVSAEIAVFIKTSPTPPKSPVFVLSQRGNEMYVMAAYFDAKYVTYIRDSGPVSGHMDDGFLRVMTIGPWKIANDVHMEKFAQIALAISIRGGQ